MAKKESCKKGTWGGKRPGGGRPSLAGEAKKQVTYRLSVGAIAKIKRIAEETGRSQAAVIEEAVRDLDE